MSRPTATLSDIASFAVSQKEARDRADLGILEAAIAWCAAVAPASVVPQLLGDRGLQLGGEGVEPVSEYAPDEFGALLSMSTDAARGLMAEALELSHRLPRTWARVQSGEVSPWRGRIIARATICLPPAAALWVDEQVSWFAERIGPAQLARVVDAAIARFSLTHLVRETSDDPREVRIDLDPQDPRGLAYVTATVDSVDGVDLDRALDRRASQLMALGTAAPHDVRRAWALGDMARQDLALDLVADEAVDPLSGEILPPVVTPAAPPTELRVHVMASELEAHAAGDDEDALLARIENTNQLVTLDALREWLQRTGASIRVQPVVDTEATLHSTRYEVPERMRRQVEARSPECVFPYCHRSASRGDVDHISPYDAGGATSSDNLAPLCRHHHRAKTHGDWTYTRIDHAVFLWRSPSGAHWLRDRSGTRRI